MKRNRIQKQLVSLCLGELAASITFVIVFVYTLRILLRLSIDVVMVYPFSMLIFILLQGSFYWFYSIRKIKDKKKIRRVFVKTYRFLRYLDLIIIAAYPFVLVCLLVNGIVPILRIENFVAIFIYLFGVGEYVNYFYIRLSYSKMDDIIKLIKLKNLRSASLYKELNKKDI